MSLTSIAMRSLGWLEGNVLWEIVRIGAGIVDAAAGRGVVVAEVVDADVALVAVADVVGTVVLDTRKSATDFHGFTRMF